MNELALFAGAGGGILGGKLLGWRTVCAVERDGYAAQVLAQRQNDGCLEPFPIWSDVCSFDGKPWRGIVDVVSGGFPCQDISSAGKGAGLDGERSGLWREMARIIGEVRPRFVFVENSPMLTLRGLGAVLGDLAAMGFDARWGVLGASAIGAPHRRERIWIVAYADPDFVRAPWTFQAQRGAADLHKHGVGEEGQVGSWWEVQPEPCSVVYGMAGVVDRLRPFGNGQVPSVAATAWRLLTHNAQYKCVEDGRTTYAEMPCSPRATAVAIRVPEVTAEQANQARQAYLRQRSVVIEAMRDNLRAGRDPGLSTDIIRREQAITEIQIKQMEAEARRRR